MPLSRTCEIIFRDPWHRGLGDKLVACVAAGLLVCAATGANAGWLSRLAKVGADVGETGAKIGKSGIAALDGLAAHIAKLPASKKGVAALAAHATPEGHWKFVNRQGEVFTAATPDELARAAGVLAPELPSGGRLHLYLSADTVFDQRKLIGQLPETADLYVLSGNRSFKLRRGPTGGVDELLAEAGRNLLVELADRLLFEEAIYQLGRRLNRSNVRVLSLEPGGPRHLGGAPRIDPKTNAALVDVIDPAALGTSLRRIKGQMAVLSGRVEGEAFFFRTARGGEQRLDLGEIRDVAKKADVNLVVLHSGAAHQPGGRNWFWQKVGVKGLDTALKRATYGDFLNALAGGNGKLTVSAARDGAGRIRLQAVPAETPTISVPENVNSWVGDLFGHTTGHIAVHAATLYSRDKERQDELDVRLIPGVPSWIQFTYFGLLILGLMGWTFSTSWWQRVWPPEEPTEYRGRAGYYLARVVRGLAFFFVFVPLAGLPAFIATISMQLLNIVMAPVRFVRWLIGKLSGAPA